MERKQAGKCPKGPSFGELITHNLAVFFLKMTRSQKIINRFKTVYLNKMLNITNETSEVEAGRVQESHILF